MTSDAQGIAFETCPVVSLRTWPGEARYWFDHAAYDEETDRLRLSCGPQVAVSAYVTPEGHVVRLAANGGYVCGLVITDVRRRLSCRGRIDLTLRDLERLSLSIEDMAAALAPAGR